MKFYMKSSTNSVDLKFEISLFLRSISKSGYELHLSKVCMFESNEK